MTGNRVIIVPGLGDKTLFLNIIAFCWRMYGLQCQTYCFNWNTEGFEEKLNVFIEHIDKFVKAGDIVSLIGISAGGSAVLNASLERKTSIHRIISVCGYLRKDIPGGTKTFKVRAAKNPTFAQSVNRLESKEALLSISERKNILTIRARFRDQLIPDMSATIPGAKNIEIFSFRHGLTIALAMTIFSGVIASFIKSREE